eukprot:Gb_00485 [translate_table: standard]
MKFCLGRFYSRKENLPFLMKCCYEIYYLLGKASVKEHFVALTWTKKLLNFNITRVGQEKASLISRDSVGKDNCNSLLEHTEIIITLLYGLPCASWGESNLQDKWYECALLYTVTLSLISRAPHAHFQQEAMMGSEPF